MRWIPVCISLFFIRIIDRVRPYIIKANSFVRTISGILSRPIYKDSNRTIIVGFMDHNPKEAAIKKYK